jgi:hypothetical protein
MVSNETYDYCIEKISQKLLFINKLDNNIWNMITNIEEINFLKEIINEYKNKYIECKSEVEGNFFECEGENEGDFSIVIRYV